MKGVSYTHSIGSMTANTRRNDTGQGNLKTENKLSSLTEFRNLVHGNRDSRIGEPRPQTDILTSAAANETGGMTSYIDAPHRHGYGSPMTKLRFQVTLHPVVEKQARTIMKLTGFTGLSEFLESLVRAEAARHDIKIYHTFVGSVSKTLPVQQETDAPKLPDTVAYKISRKPKAKKRTSVVTAQAKSIHNP
jgi:hypothetical protein